MLMNIFDVDRSGTISFTGAYYCPLPLSRHSPRFQSLPVLWKYISDWQNVFRHFDRDRSGSIDGQELADALGNFGYRLTPQLLQLIEQKYGTQSHAMSLTASHECTFFRTTSRRANRDIRSSSGNYFRPLCPRMRGRQTTD